MKENAPEKIYLGSKQRLDKEIFHVFTTLVEDDDIEYVRKDAFIEKAAEWLSEIENGTTITDIDKFVEDFKKAMEGE